MSAVTFQPVTAADLIPGASIYLHVGSSPMPSALGAAIKRAGGTYDACRGHHSMREINLPANVDAALVARIVTTLGRGGMAPKGHYTVIWHAPVGCSYVPAGVSVQHVPIEQADQLVAAALEGVAEAVNSYRTRFVSEGCDHPAFTAAEIAHMAQVQVQRDAEQAARRQAKTEELFGRMCKLVYGDSRDALDKLQHAVRKLSTATIEQLVSDL